MVSHLFSTIVALGFGNGGSNDDTNIVETWDRPTIIIILPREK